MAELLQQAIRHHQAGRLDQAEELYRQILQADPDQPDALHLVGVIAYQRGKLEEAADWIRKAIAINPNAAPFHCNLGEVCRTMGRLDQAVAHLKAAIALKSDYAEAWSNLGLALQGMGKVDEAVEHFRRAIQLQPRYAMAYVNLGSALREQEHLDEAVEAFRQAVRLAPNLPEAQSDLGQALMEKGELDAALEHCRRAIELRPIFAQAQSNLGNVLRALGQLEQAKACYATAIRLRPDLAMPYGNMGQAVQEEGKYDEAIRWYEQALAREPNAARFHTYLASALEERGDTEQALERYRLALQLQPTYAEAHTGLAHLCQEEGHTDEARRHYAEALRLKPDSAPMRVQHGHFLAEMGEFDAAIAMLREALRIDPKCPGAYGQLATALGEKLSEEDARAMQELLKEPHLTEGNRAAMNSGLARHFDAKQEYAKAAEHSRLANAFERVNRAKRGETYDPEGHRQFVDRIIRTFSKEYFDKVRGWGLETEAPVFIVGMPRSGTTLLEQILASHSKIFGAGELPVPRQALESLPAILKAQADPLACIGRLDRPTVQAVAQAHLEKLRQLSADAERIVDKMPDNYLYLGLIATTFPNARIIHCRRDMRDVAVSCWITQFRVIRWACDETWIAARVREYLRLMDHWRAALPVPMLEMDYEAVVEDLEGSARRLVAWCGMEWEPRCLSFHETKRQIKTASLRQVRQPIYSTSVARWKRYQEHLPGLFSALATGLPPSAGS